MTTTPTEGTRVTCEDIVTGTDPEHLHRAIHMDQPEPSEREALYTPSTGEVRNNMAFAAACAWAALNGPDDELAAAMRNVDWPVPGMRVRAKEQFDRWLAAHDAEVLAARPAPVVSAEALAEVALIVEFCANSAPLDSERKANPAAAWRAHYLDAARQVLAALGLTVADTPAAEPEYEVSPGAFMTVEDCTPAAPERCRCPGALVIPPAAEAEVEIPDGMVEAPGITRLLRAVGLTGTAIVPTPAADDEGGHDR